MAKVEIEHQENGDVNYRVYKDGESEPSMTMWSGPDYPNDNIAMAMENIALHLRGSDVVLKGDANGIS